MTVQKVAPDTEVHISADPTQVLPGGALTLTVTERNTGNVALSGVWVNVSKTGADIADVASLGWSGSTTGNHDSTLDVGETWTWTLQSGSSPTPKAVSG